MVGWFIEYEQVISLEHQSGQLDACLFPPAQVIDVLQHFILGEQEAAEHCSDVTFFHVRVFMPEFFEYSSAGRKFSLLLIIVTDGYIRSVNDFSAVFRKMFCNRFDERRFTDAIRPDDRYAVAFIDIEADTLIQWLFVSDADIFYPEYVIAAFPFDIKGKVGISAVLHRHIDAIHMFKLFASAFGHAACRGSCNILFNKRLEPLYLFLLLFVGLHLQVEPFFFLHCVFCIVGVVKCPFEHFNFEYPVDSTIEKVAVMADDYDRTAEALQIRSEEHTSELQSRGHLVCRLLLEKKK